MASFIKRLVGSIRGGRDAGPAGGTAATAPPLPAPADAGARGRGFADRMVCVQGEPGSTVARGPNRLEAFFERHTEGPGLWKWHHYFEIYDRHFSKFVGRQPTILEVGVFSGGSLLMWQDYFGPGCRIYGIDKIEECRQFETGSVRIILGDQGDRGFWQRLKAEIPPVDIIVDDGSHKAEHQIVTLEEMLPHLKPGGVYLCEDIYEPPFDDFIDGFGSRMNTIGPPLPGLADVHKGMAVNAVQRNIHSIHRYPLVTVIERAPAPVDALATALRGTHWLWEFWR